MARRELTDEQWYAEQQAEHDRAVRELAREKDPHRRDFWANKRDGHAATLTKGREACCEAGRKAAETRRQNALLREQQARAAT